MEDSDTDPEAEWSIQEYSSKECNSKLRWMLNKGLMVGKKILVTGFVISSAPIVLPPLAVVSIIGFACSVPYGLFLASYACTNKLMSKLLPESEPPQYLLEYGMVSSTNEEFENDENNGEGEDLGVYGDINREKEEEEMSEDTRKSVEMRIELVENEKGDEDGGQGGFRNNEQELVSDVSEIVEENGYEEDVGEDVDKEEEEPIEEIELKIEGVGEEEEKQPVVAEVKTVVVNIKREEKSSSAVEDTGTTFKVTNVVVGFFQDADVEEDEEIVRETTGLLEKIREEGMADNGEESRQSVEMKMADNRDAEEWDLRDDSHVEEIRMPYEARNYYSNVKGEKPLRETESKIYKNEDDETTAESWEMPETIYAQNVDVILKEPEPVIGDLLATKESDEVLEDEKPIGEVSGTTDNGFAGNVDVVPKEMKPKPVVGDLSATKESDNVSGAEKSTSEMSGTTDVGGNIAEEQKPVVDKASQKGGRANDNITKDEQQDSQLNQKKEIVISTNADAREIADESGFDLFDYNNVAAQPYSEADSNTVEDVVSTENERSSSHAGLESADDNDTGISSQKDTGMASSKVHLIEEKILEKIEAMRVIVGYKAVRRPTCLEELKALYLFTGVEPPATFKDPSDLMEVNDKLRFLMSIVGVK